MHASYLGAKACCAALLHASNLEEKLHLVLRHSPEQLARLPGKHWPEDQVYAAAVLTGRMWPCLIKFSHPPCNTQ